MFALVDAALSVHLVLDRVSVSYEPGSNKMEMRRLVNVESHGFLILVLEPRKLLDDLDVLRYSGATDTEALKHLGLLWPISKKHTLIYGAEGLIQQCIEEQKIPTKEDIEACQVGAALMGGSKTITRNTLQD